MVWHFLVAMKEMIVINFGRVYGRMYDINTQYQ